MVINFLWPLNPIKYAVFVAGNCNQQTHSVYQINCQYFRQAQLNIFNIPPVRGQIGVIYVMVNSIKICHIWALYHLPIQNSTKFRENIQIPRIGSKFRGKLWSLPIDSMRQVEYCGCQSGTLLSQPRTNHSLVNEIYNHWIFASGTPVVLGSKKQESCAIAKTTTRCALYI